MKLLQNRQRLLALGWTFILWTALTGAKPPPSGDEKEEFEMSGNLKPTVPVEKLLAAPEEISVEGRKMILKTTLWRDFMPISPPDGKPLVASVSIETIDLKELPSSLTADRLWVIQDRKEAWESEPSDEPGPPKGLNEKHLLQKIARNGPKWGPQTEVDVVVRIRDAKNNAYYLKASHQPIQRTD